MKNPQARKKRHQRLPKLRVCAVFLFPNGMFAVTDQYGNQIGSLQGRDTPQLRKRLDARITAKTELYGYRPAHGRGLVVD